MIYIDKKQLMALQDYATAGRAKLVTFVKKTNI